MERTTKKIVTTSPEVLTLTDSDDEIFVGPVTDKERKKAAKLSRRTQVFFPPVSWKLRSSNHSIKESKESSMFQQHSSPMRNEANKRVQSLVEEKKPSSPSCHDMKHNLNLNKHDSLSESPSNGYIADISSAGKSNCPVSDPDSLEYGDFADSLNSLSRDSLDVDHDSLEENKEGDLNPVRDSTDTSMVEDLYDAGEFLNGLQTERNVSISTAPKQLTSEEIEELQKQLGSLAMEIGDGGNGVEESLEKHNNSLETAESESPVNPNIESIFTKNQGLPSPYDLNKQRLSGLLPSDTVDIHIEGKRYLTDAKGGLDTVRELSEPSSSDIESGVRLSEEYPDSFCESPRKGSTDNLPNSTLFFEELERQVEVEERLHSDHQMTYTVLSEPQHDEMRSDCGNSPDATYTLLSNVETQQPGFSSNTEGTNSLHSSSQYGHDVSGDSCPEGVFNDTLEGIEMLLKYGVDYIYDKHGKAVDEEAPVQEEMEDRPKSADSCGSRRSGRSTPGARAIKARTPVKRPPLTPSKTQPKVCRTPVKTPTSSKPPVGAEGSVESNPARGPPRTVTPRSAPTYSTKLAEPASKKTLPPVEKIGNETPKFKIPAKIPMSVGRVSRAQSAAAAVTYSPRPNKFLNQIQSPIGAYIHNSPSPVLMTNVKPKTCTPRDHEKRQIPVWDSVGARNHKVEGSENINPNVGHGLRAVHYIQAPCVKLDDHSLPKSRLPRLGDRFEKLLDSPCPQVIKHEGRVRVNPSSPQYKAAVKAVRKNLNDSTNNVAASGDISVCVSKVVKRTNTLSLDH